MYTVAYARSEVEVFAFTAFVARTMSRAAQAFNVKSTQRYGNGERAEEYMAAAR